MTTRAKELKLEWHLLALETLIVCKDLAPLRERALQAIDYHKHEADILIKELNENK